MTTASNTGHDPEQIARMILLALIVIGITAGMLIGIGIKALIG